MSLNYRQENLDKHIIIVIMKIEKVLFLNITHFLLQLLPSFIFQIVFNIFVANFQEKGKYINPVSYVWFYHSFLK